jgi:hypothetical protein
MTQIEGAPTSNFIIPQPHIHETEDGALRHAPIKPITRLLFWNGLVTQAEPSGTWPSNESRWFFVDDSNVDQPQTQFPLASYVEECPPTAATFNINWEVERGYANDYPGYVYGIGVSAFTEYWSQYITNIYNKYSRKMTAYFYLTPSDLERLTFDDVIFAAGSYWRPAKIVDAPVGGSDVVKVELIKLINYTPS